MHASRKQPYETTLLAHVALLFGTVAAASYAGTSNLFAAYLAGAPISWYYSEEAQSSNANATERIETTQITVIRGVQQAALEDGDTTRNEEQSTSDDGTGRGEQLDTPMVPGTQATQEPDVQNRETERGQSSLSGASIYMNCIE